MVKLHTGAEDMTVKMIAFAIKQRLLWLKEKAACYFDRYHEVAHSSTSAWSLLQRK